MTTSEPTNPKKDPLTWSAEDSHVRTSAAQDAVLGSWVSEAVSGRRWPESSELFVRSGSLRKMFRPYAVEGLPWSFKISARSGMMRNGTVSPLPPLVRLTDGIGSGSSLIATPTATANQLCPSMQKHPGCRAMWPTPQASDHIQKRTSKSWAAKGAINQSLANPEITGVTGGKLNPRWIEWLMGYPDGWTDLSNSETASSPKSPN